MTEQKYYIGVDVSKNTLDFALVDEGKLVTHEVIGNAEKSINKLLKQWQKQYEINLSEVWICLEHTGIYSYRLLDFLEKNTCKVCLESAYTIKHSNGLQRGKNDKIDAERIAMYAWTNRDKIQQWQPSKAIIKDLKQLMTMRKGLVNAMQKLQVHVKETGKFISKQMAKELEKSCAKSLNALKADIKTIEEKIMQIVRADEQLSKLFDLVTSVDGIGKITAWVLLVTTNGFSSFKEGKKYACYAGVVPFEHTSGKSIRGKKRVSHMANKEVKVALHLAALSTIRGKGDLGVYYRRKVEEGKNKMSVLNAIRNKIVLRVFACVRDNRQYENNYQKIAA
jgi:transposase